MRDIIRLFADRDSRDELGLGQVRDAIGDGLFPGTSTLLTRARYLLFVPWVYQKAARRKNALADADRYERAVISAIKGTDDYAGLLGMRTGVALRNLPSTVYWSMLRRYRILDDPALSREDTLRLHGLSSSLDELDGTATRFQAWSPTLPGPPPGFPGEIPGGFALTYDEAAWLRDRILDEAPGTLFAHLTLTAPSPDSPQAWMDPAALTAGGDARVLLYHARDFSTVMHGAQLLYNLLLAEQYEAAGLVAITDPVERYRARLDDWAHEVPADLMAWDLDAFLTRVELLRGAPVHAATWLFLRRWADVLRETAPAGIPDSATARALVTAREHRNKGAQARLGNPRRLETWGGASGAGAFAYRWPTARGILLDIHDGLARTPGDTDV